MSSKDKLGVIICEDNRSAVHGLWMKSYLSIFKHLGIDPHIISNSKQAKRGYKYIWRPNHDNFLGIHKNTKLLSEELSRVATEYEKRGAAIFPSSREISFYENKRRIADVAKRLSIDTPKTEYCVSLKTAIRTASGFDQFPILVKSPYSCNSYGLTEIKARSEIDCVLRKFFDTFSSCVLQEKMNIKKDLRVNLIGNQAVCAYWRLKQNDQISTASRFGGQIDHWSVPYAGVQFAIDVAKRMGFETAGVDIAWDNDNLSNQPKLLEISPIFDLNPVPPRPETKWQSFKRSWGWGRHYHQILLEVAANQISFLRWKQVISSR